MAQGQVHIAGADVRVGSRKRQRCGWCGAIIFDYDLANIAVRDQPDGSPGNEPSCFETGRLVRVEGGFPQTLTLLPEADEVPDDCCAMIDDLITT